TPEAVIDTVIDLQIRIPGALEIAHEAFKIAYSYIRVPFATYTNVINTVDSALSLITSAKNSVANVPSFTTLLNDVKARVHTMGNDAEDIATSLGSLVTFGTFPLDPVAALTTTNARDQFDEILKLFDFEATVPGADDNGAQMTAVYFQQVSAIAAAGISGSIQYDSLNDAEEVTAKILNKLDELQGGAISDEVYT
ncbi:MAG: hypothetical protein GY869_08680, partial [Planctomycetes bacterium]|nr:hypothetical protein [Planctomycetota bacterium]